MLLQLLVGVSELKDEGEYSSHTSQICCLSYMIREPELTETNSVGGSSCIPTVWFFCCLVYRNKVGRGYSCHFLYGPSKMCGGIRFIWGYWVDVTRRDEAQLTTPVQWLQILGGGSLSCEELRSFSYGESNTQHPRNEIERRLSQRGMWFPLDWVNVLSRSECIEPARINRKL
jgi:hypothetical protein